MVQNVSLSVVVPVYKSTETLIVLYQRITECISKYCSDFEIIFVEDCGGDESWQVIEQLCEMDASVVGIKLTRNYGQHNALLCGIRSATKDITITIDDDLQNPPEEIEKLLERLQDGYDVVYGTPKKMQHGVWRNTASKITKIVLQGAMGAENARHVSAFRAFRTELRVAFDDYQGSFVNLDVLLTWATTGFSFVEVRHDERFQGESNYNFRKLLAHGLNMMTGFSAIPLQLASILGFILTLLGFVLLGYILVNYFQHGSSVPGFAFLASMIALFSGAQLFALGMIGEYIARIHFRVMDRPAYCIKAISKSKAS